MLKFNEMHYIRPAVEEKKEVCNDLKTVSSYLNSVVITTS